ncbi:MAG TPA: hypothetical protein VFE25_03800 [Opitutaceae bacterium]|nr:hypothetical protein [Opitutaceae bacterium]
MKFILSGFAWLFVGAGVLSAENNAPGIAGVEAVASKVSADYVRSKQADGAFAPEFYSFGNGGNWGGELKDLTIDKLGFTDVARAIAPALRTQNYLPASDPTKTKLLVMLYWGTTAVPPPYQDDTLYQNYQQSLQTYRIMLSEGDPDADNVLSAGLHQLDIANGIRDRLDFRNSLMLGYDASGLVGTDRGKYLQHTALRTETLDEREEIEENRYFVVLMAYDFQLMWKQKKHKLLWEARFSVNERHNEFDKALPAMAQYAARYFGRPTNGLIRKRLLNDNVEIGEPTLIQFISETKK